jgi:hypothetical protein
LTQFVVLLGVQDSSDIWKACKMMENTISWGMGNVDHVIPAFVGLAVTKLLDEENGDILMIACVNVVLSALRYNPEMVVLSMESASPEGMRVPSTSISQTLATPSQHPHNAIFCLQVHVLT